MAKKPTSKKVTPPEANPDPLTDEPGSHPIGTGIGATIGGAAAGAAAGSVAGPVGTIVGTAVGAVAGGYAGKAAEEYIDPTIEDAYWRENYRNRSYVGRDAAYDEYEPAYRYGWESFATNRDRKFEEVEPGMASKWETFRGSKSKLGWSDAKPAVRDAWDRLEVSLADTNDLPPKQPR
jgi:hypothetical protein